MADTTTTTTTSVKREFIGQVIDIPLKDIEAPKDWNAREHERELDELASSILQDGQRTPVEVTPNAEGGFTLVSGFRRYKAISKLARKTATPLTIRASVINGDAAGLRWSNLLENIHRHALSGYEIAKGFSELVHVHKWSVARIVEKYGSDPKGEEKQARGFSLSNVTNLVRAFDKLSDKARAAWQAGKLSNEAAFRLMSRDAKEQDDLLPRVMGLSGANLTRAVDEYDNPEIEGGEEKGEKSEKSEKGQGRQGLRNMQAAIEFAEEQGADDAAAALRWAIGETKSLTLAGKRFSGKAARKRGEKSEEN